MRLNREGKGEVSLSAIPTMAPTSTVTPPCGNGSAGELLVEALLGLDCYDSVQKVYSIHSCGAFCGSVLSPTTVLCLFHAFSDHAWYMFF